MMADNPIIITLPYTADLDRGPVEQYLPVAFGTGDKEAHKLILTAYRATGIVDLTGAGVMCYVNRADKTTVVVDGEVVDGKAVVVLPEECYIVNGVVSIIVKLTMGDTRTTALWLNGNINRTRNGKLVDPGGVVPSLEELLAQIDNMEAATAEATAAAETAQKAATDSEQRTTTAIEETQQKADEAIARVHETLAGALGDVSDAMAEAAPAILLTASGEVVQISDGAARPALSLVSQISAVQRGTGDPSPDNIRPIVGWDALTLTRSGRNMLDPTALRQVQISTGETRWGMQYTRPGTYALHANVAGGDADYVYARVTDGSGAAVGDTMYLVTGSAVKAYTVTLEAGQTLTVWYVRDLDQATAAECLARTQAQIEMDSRTAYVPGQSTAITAALPETVYGGSLDWTTGVLTVTHKRMIADGVAKTVYNIGYSATSAETYATVAVGSEKGVDTTAARETMIADSYRTDDFDSNNAARPGRAYITGGGTVLVLCSIDQTLDTIDKFNAALSANPVTVVYELASPYTIQLDPQTLALLRGENRIWSEAGASAVGYIADTQLYVDTHGGSGGDAGFAKYAEYAERAGEADNALAVGGLQVQAVPITDWDTITPDAGTVYLVYDPEVTG